MTRNYPPRSPPALPRLPPAWSPSNFRLFVQLKQRLYTISLSSRSSFQVGRRQPWRVYLRTKAVGDKTGAWRMVLPSGSLPEAQGPHAGCRGETLSCVPSSASTNVGIWG